MKIHVMGFESSLKHESERHVHLYTSVLYVPVLACAGIGQDLAFSDFSPCLSFSGNIAMTSKKKHVLEVKYINSGPKKKGCLHLCKADLVYNKRSTTNLLQHLRLRYLFEFAAYKEKQLRPVSMRETPFTMTCTPDLHLKTHGPVVEPIEGASESIKCFEPAQLLNPPVASTPSTAC